MVASANRSIESQQWLMTDSELGCFMFDNSDNANPEGSPRQILLGYLNVWTLRWPGGDGLSEDDVLSCLPRAMAEKAVPSIRELCRLHPEMATALRSFIAKLGILDGSESCRESCLGNSDSHE